MTRNPQQFRQTFALHYVDEFYWTDSKNVDIKSLFNENSNNLAKEFFNSQRTVYNLTTEKTLGGSKYLDRLEIKVTPPRPTATVSHNITQTLKGPTSLREIIDNGSLKDILSVAHQRNKDLLNDILQDDIKKLINL